MSTQEVTLNSPLSILQPWSLATQGYLAPVVSPLSLAQSKAESIHPPLHPWFPQDLEQSTSCCSEMSKFYSPLILKALSMAAVAEKAQHDPHDAWFFTGVTFPSAFQSMSPPLTDPSTSRVLMDLLGTWRVRYMASNSAEVRSVNWLTPIVQVFLGLALCSLMVMRFLRKMLRRYCSSPSRVQRLPNSRLYCSKEQASVAGVVSRVQRQTEATPRTIKAAIRLLFIGNDYISIKQVQSFKL